MTVPTWAKIASALVPIALSPVAVYLGPGAQGCYYFGALFGAVFGICVALPYRRAA